MTKLRTAFVVIGMHRSGTSALAGTLAHCGAALPKRLMAPSFDNKKGFFEPEAIAALNDEILSSVDASWDDVFVGRERQFLSNFDTVFTARAIEALEADYGNANPFVMKDPRVSVIAPLWERAMEAVGARPHFVIAVRNPLEVAASLQARNGFSTARALMMWLSYSLAAERDTRGRPRVFVSYDHLLSNWRREIGRVERAFGVSMPRMTPTAANTIDAYLSREDRHHAMATDAIADRADLIDAVGRVYGLMVDLAADRDVDLADFDAARAEMEYFDRALGPIVAEQQASLKATRDALQAEAQKAQSLEEARAAAVAETERLAAERAEFEAKTREEFAHLTDQIEFARRALADGEARFRAEETRLNLDLEDARRLRAELEARFAEDDARLRAELEAARQKQLELEERLALEAGRQGDELDTLRRQQAELEARLAAEEARLRDEAAVALAGQQEVEARLTALLDALHIERDEQAARLEALTRETEDLRAAHAEEIAGLYREAEELRVANAAAFDAFAQEAAGLRAAHADERAALHTRLAEADGARADLEARMEQAQIVFEAGLRGLNNQLREAEDREAALRAEAEASRAEAEVRLAAAQAEAATEREALERTLRAAIDRAVRDYDRLAIQIAEERGTARAEQDRLSRRLAEEEAGRAAAETSLRASRESAATEIRRLAESLALREEATRRQVEDVRALTALRDDLERRLTGRTEEAIALANELAAIRNSTSWKATDPLRRILARSPGLARLVRAPVKLVWWTLTGRLFSKLAARKAAREAASGAAKEDDPGRPYASFAPVIAFARRKFGPGANLDWLTGHGTTFRLRPDGATEPVEADAVQAMVATMRERADGWPEVNDPDVSIILPVHNQLNYTLSAITALFSSPTRYSFEIIVADDASTDLTPQVFATPHRRVRLVRQEANLGFVRNCNAAAATARGRYLVFLNNDTVVLPGWLDGLIDELAAHPEIGLSGSQLIYPNGRLQEAGGILWRDGSAWNYGRGGDPLAPAVAYARDVDYISGAAIAVPTALWRELGGFDEAFAPAYGEDSDLAFRVRAAGHRVRYQPRSVAVHFEGITSGTDVTQGVKAHQVTNARTFARRWAETLATHRTNGTEPEREKERQVQRRVLFIDACTPEPDKDAGSVTCLELMAAFQANGFKVTFIPDDNFLFMPKETGELQARGIEAIYADAWTSTDAYLKAHGGLFDAVVVLRVATAARTVPSIRRHAPNARILFHTTDLHFLREQREAALSGNAALAAAAEKTREKELGLIAKVHLTIVHSEAEVEHLREAAPSAKVYLFPWILDPVGRIAAPGQRRDVLFLGGYRHPPNVDAVLHFASAIWPRVHAALPEARFRVVGSEAPPEILKLHGRDGIDVVGWVAELQPEFERARVSVAPLRYGAGIKGKVAVSLAHGVPGVLTNIAAEGMGLRNGEEALIDDSPEGFADAIIRLYRDDDLWLRLSDAGLSFVGRTYGRQLGQQRVAEMMALVAR